MAIEAAQLDDLAVQLETVVGELRFAESDDARDLIDLASTAPERDIARGRDWDVDRSHSLMPFRFARETECATGSLAAAEAAILCEPFATTRSPSRRTTSTRNGSREDSRCWTKQSTSRLGCPLSTFFGLAKHIFDKCRRNDTERNFAIDAAEGQVIDFVAKGRDIGALGWSQRRRPARFLR